ncbi:neprilysin-2-like isoform X2 [Linepithema humile]|uniref:neprilysin-2-like isoform X2 n=1 Tax=Linepithema humile TaxID=83485 RepID=UPI00351F6888
MSDFQMREINNRETNNHEQNKLAQWYRSYRCYFVVLLLSVFVCIILLSVLIGKHAQSQHTESALQETTPSPNIAITTTPKRQSEDTTEKPKSKTTTSGGTGITTPVSQPVTTTITPTAIASTTIMPITIDENKRNFMKPIKLLDENINVCNTIYDTQITSKMSFYMNVSANPCNDFYKYACGNFEANLQLADIDLVQRTNIYQRIEKQMIKENLTFAIYYRSCVKYERTVSFSERIKMARDALNRVGQFYINNTCSADSANFTNLFANLILHHSAFLFDIVPEIDEEGSHNFTLKISPTTYENLFETEFMNSYFGNNLEMDSDYEAPEPLCSNKERKENDRNDEIKRSISEALTELHIFKDLNNSTLESERINEIINVIDSVIMQTYFSNFSSENNNKEVYLINHYKRINLTELKNENNNTFVNWTQLIDLLLETNNETNKDIQVYFHKELSKGSQSLANFSKTNCTGLNNAIMALYARKLYQELVMPRQNAKAHCLRVATYLLRPEATNLYLSSFADHEIERMNNRTTYMFNELKQTLKKKINVTLPEGNGKETLLNKTDSLELALPPVSYFKNKELLYSDYNMAQNLSKNYFNNSINLMKRYRTLMYTEIRREFKIRSEQIWTYYATPFQLQAKIIYCLSQIAIPYGMIELHSASNEDSFNYVVRTTLGNLIAHQIVHLFDNLDYWNLTENTHLFEIFKNNSIDIKILETTEPLPSTNQTECSKLILNKKSSEIIKFRLVKETLDSMMPSVKLDIKQLFYLAYTQAYCSKSRTSSFVAPYENKNENLRNRDRIAIVKSNDESFAKMWNCTNSQNNPE